MFPDLLQEVSGESDLKQAGIDLVVKTHDNIRPLPDHPEPYEEFCRTSGTQSLFDLEHHCATRIRPYLASPFDDAAILTIDGTGETSSGSAAFRSPRRWQKGETTG